MGLGFERADLVDETLGIYEDAQKPRLQLSSGARGEKKFIDGKSELWMTLPMISAEVQP